MNTGIDATNGSDLLDLAVTYRAGAFSLDVALESDASPLVVIGPSGSGKSLLLRIIAGILRPDSGHIVVKGKAWFDGGHRVDLPARNRRVGYVPQEYALFPHLTVEGNIGYGLRGAADRKRQRVNEMLELVGLANHRHHRPRELSGGQRQRVALARALAVSPDLLLLDEPFSSLDEPNRETLLADVQRLITATATPTIVVTHDRTETLRLASQVAVIMSGAIRQAGSPAEVFSAPVDDEVANFVGVETIAEGRVERVADNVATVRVGPCLIEGGTQAEPGTSVLVCLRPEDVVLGGPNGRPASSSVRNRLLGRVTRIALAGPFIRVEVDAGFRLVALITKHALEDLELAPGSEVTATFKATAVHLIARG
jgi:molybdenum ABC transporter ATP-binding protein